MKLHAVFLFNISVIISTSCISIMTSSRWKSAKRSWIYFQRLICWTFIVLFQPIFLYILVSYNWNILLYDDSMRKNISLDLFTGMKKIFQKIFIGCIPIFQDIHSVNSSANYPRKSAFRCDLKWRNSCSRRFHEWKFRKISENRKKSILKQLLVICYHSGNDKVMSIGIDMPHAKTVGFCKSIMLTFYSGEFIELSYIFV